MIDISYLVSTFFPSHDVYLLWLDNKVIVLPGMHKSHTFLTAKDIQEIKSLNKENVEVSDICSKYNLSKDSFHRIISGDV